MCFLRVGCRASSESLHQPPSWRSWKPPWTVEFWMCRSTPPTHTPSQVNNTPTRMPCSKPISITTTPTHFLYPSMLKAMIVIYICQLFYDVESAILKVISKVLIGFGRGCQKILLFVYKRCANFISSNPSAMFLKPFCSDIAVHFTL